MVTRPRALSALVLGLALAACTVPTYEPPPKRPVTRTSPSEPPAAGTPVITPAPAPELPPPPEPIPPPPAPPSSGATAALLQQSRRQAAAGNYPLATSSLERALRINPQDPELWLELGRIKLRQGDYAQAENMGRRGLAVAGNDAARRAQCEELIAAARRRTAE